MHRLLPYLTVLRSLKEVLAKSLLWISRLQAWGRAERTIYPLSSLADLAHADRIQLGILQAISFLCSSGLSEWAIFLIVCSVSPVVVY